MNAVDFARELIDIDSTTGREQEAGEWLTRSLRSLGYRVDQQPVSDGRCNVVATVDDPVVVLSTHYDCVPPSLSELDAGRPALRPGGVRRERHPGGAGRVPSSGCVRPEKRGSGCCSWSARSGAAMVPTSRMPIRSARSS